VIVGTAGHIDHGKTALVRALTGIDTDRLEEEKRRGITIELGFAHLETEGPHGPVHLGFVDVPGHERFVHTMLAGVCGVDLVLFVVSAQESVRPQTREHFDICRLLKVSRGIVVLTKCDLVDEVTLAVVRAEVGELVAGSFLDPAVAPMIAVSSRTGEGLDRLRRELARLAAETVQKDVHAAFRLPIDRVFAVKGFGTVVTGTLIGGRIGVDQEVDLLPGGRRVRVRGVQVHGESRPFAVAGERTAINLAGIAQDEIARGMMLTAPDLLDLGDRLDVRLSLSEGAPELKSGSPLHLSLHTAEQVARVRFHEVTTLRPGETAWARLRLSTPIPCAPGDRFIVRRFSPVVTIGGGEIVDVAPPRRTRGPARIAMLERLADGDDLDRLTVIVARAGRRGLRRDEAIPRTGWTAERLRRALQRAIAAKEILCVADLLVTTAVFDRLTRELYETIKAFQIADPLAGGIGRQEAAVGSGLDRALFTAAVEALAAAGRLEITGDQLHLPGLRVTLRDEEAVSKQRIKEAFVAAGMQVPSLDEVLGGLGIDRDRARKLVTLLLRDRVLVRLGDDLVFHRDALKELRDRVRAMRATTPWIGVADFKEAFGLSRKYAIPLLEYLDRERVTRRHGDRRQIL
jgi:selenocysteine-specific elongation factor